MNIEYTPFQGLVAKQTLLITVLILLFGCGEETDDTFLITDGGQAPTADLGPSDVIPSQSDASVDGGFVPSNCEEPQLKIAQMFNLDLVPLAPVQTAQPWRFGTVITPTGLICDGNVLFDKNSTTILCVDSNCEENPLAAEATIVCSDILLPGLIDPHNHMSYNTLPPWQTDGVYLRIEINGVVGSAVSSIQRDRRVETPLSDDTMSSG